MHSPAFKKDQELLVARKGGVVLATLNRPGALNALTLEMIRMISAGLSAWAEDEGVQSIIIEGAGERAFCAGGDIKVVYLTGMRYRKEATDERVLSLFFAEEYRLNRQLYHFDKPIVAIMDGITMGGGFGIAGPCLYRVATPRTTFAMPEVGIGFFPDIGSVWTLDRCPDQAGTYLALTGASIGPEDALYTGVATHYIADDAALADVRARLAAGEDPKKVLSAFERNPGAPGVLEQNRELMARCFAHGTVEDILRALMDAGTDWAHKTAAIMLGRSPISMKVALEHLRRGRGQDFDTIIARDFRLVQHFLKGHDFYEGVRAAVIDKDRQPRWEPARLEAVSKADIEAYFNGEGFDLDDPIYDFPVSGN